MGIEKIPEGRKQNDLKLWFDRLLTTFLYQNFEIDTEVAMKWGDLTALPAVEALVIEGH